MLQIIWQHKLLQQWILSMPNKRENISTRHKEKVNFIKAKKSAELYHGKKSVNWL